MTIAFSTSSPLASVAFFAEDGSIAWEGEELSKHAASEKLIALMAEGLKVTGIDRRRFRRFLADLGPGSFTGVRVGVVFAKVLAFAEGGLAAGASAFDLIAPHATAFTPSRRGEVYVREAGSSPKKMPSPPPGAIGYAYDEPGVYPKASGFAQLLSELAYRPPES